MMGGQRDRFFRTASRLLGNQWVFGRVQRALSRSLGARKAFERGVGQVLAASNLPSYDEVSRLYNHIETLEREISDMTERVSVLAEEMERSSDLSRGKY